ncbi:hypothetical protein [Nocardia neocaledoniensis]|uniref:hypothetical protein n=1 Tax=Nocardia neocaledoniensis TaxID=236511 RepID=UPI0024550061|nr:hypothetical protein [Nocardia neocaledoniensis]
MTIGILDVSVSSCPDGDDSARARAPPELFRSSRLRRRPGARICPHSENLDIRKYSAMFAESDKRWPRPPFDGATSADIGRQAISARSTAVRLLPSSIPGQQTRSGEIA